jgi:putative membrane protein insertion efficiency factor
MTQRMRALLWAIGAPARLLLVALLSGYRLLVGPLTGGRCRFHPSCSAYALEAVRVHGALKGATLSTWRVLRCSPFTAGGLDPVPPRGHVFDGVIHRSGGARA